MDLIWGLDLQKFRDGSGCEVLLDLGSLEQRLQDTKVDLIDSKELRGSSAKLPSSSSSGHRGGRPWTGALAHCGAGGTGDEKLGRGTKRIEGIKGNSMGRSPRAENDGSGGNLAVNAGAALFWRRRRRLGVCSTGGRGGAASSDAGGRARAGGALPFYRGARTLAWRRRPWPGRPSRRGRKRVGSGLGPAQSGRIGFFFSEFIFNAKTISRKV
jgi:hypothetical protein